MHLAKMGGNLFSCLTPLLRGKKGPNSLIVNKKDIIIYILLVNIIMCLNLLENFMYCSYILIYI